MSNRIAMEDSQTDFRKAAQSIALQAEQALRESPTADVRQRLEEIIRIANDIAGLQIPQPERGKKDNSA